MMTQNEIQRLHDLANNPLLTDKLSARLELSVLAVRAVQLLIAQSRIRQLKALNEAEKRTATPASPTSDFANIFGDMFGGDMFKGKFK